MAAAAAMLLLLALTPAALANEPPGGEFPEVDTFDTPRVQCGSILAIPPPRPAALATAPAGGALQEVLCFSHGINCDAPCGDGLDLEWDVYQCKYDDDYDGVWDRYGPIQQTPTGWCCPPYGGSGWGW